MSYRDKNRDYVREKDRDYHRDRDYNRDRDRDGHRDKDRDRDRDRDRERARKYSKSRSRSNSTHKKKNHKEKHKKRRHSDSSSSSKSRSKSDKKSKSQSRSPSDENLGIKLAKQIVEPFERKPLYVQEPDFKTTQEESSCLIVTGLPEIMSQNQLEELLESISKEQDVLPPDNIQLVSVLKTAYVTYPTVEIAKKILFNLKGFYQIGSVKLSFDFTPNILAKQKNQGPSKDISLVQDWICDKCEYKNFAKRNKCHKCDNPRNPNCKAVYNSACYVKQNTPQQATNIFYTPVSIDPNSTAISTLQVRGSVLSELSETQLASQFEKYAAVKDAKFIKNKATGQNKESATIEFYSTEDAERVLKITQATSFRINGQEVVVTYAKKGKQDDPVIENKAVMNANMYQNRQQYPGVMGYGNNYYSDVTYTNSGQDNKQQQMYNQMQGQSNPQYSAYNLQYQQMYNQHLQQQLQAGTIQQTIAQHQQAQIQQTQPVQQSTFVKPQTPIFQNIANMLAEKKQAQAPVNLQAQALAKLTASTPTPVITAKTETPAASTTQNKIEIKFQLPTQIQISSSIASAISEEKKNAPSSPGPEEMKNKKASEIIFSEEKSFVDGKAKLKQAEAEMKKWQNEQTKLPAPVQEANVQKSPIVPKIQFSIDFDNISLDQSSEKPKISAFTISEGPSQSSKSGKEETLHKYRVLLGNIAVCRLCETKLKDGDMFDLHEKFSKLHKENLSRVKIN